MALFLNLLLSLIPLLLLSMPSLESIPRTALISPTLLSLTMGVMAQPCWLQTELAEMERTNSGG